MDFDKSHHSDRAPTDARLWRAIARGDTDALGTLYDRHAGLVYGIAIKILGNAQEAEDLAQDIFLKLADKSSYDPKRGSIRTFLVILTRSRALDRVRSRQRRQRSGLLSTHPEALSPGEPASAELAPMEAAFQREQSREVQSALATLSDSQRQVLEMTYYGGLTQAAIAEQLNIPLGTVKSRVRRGLLNLRNAIQEQS
ncbi:MAG: sigma-70 family RNA polymerase sigma factor [Elainellaceae cyanobacterium]